MGWGLENYRIWLLYAFNLKMKSKWASENYIELQQQMWKRKQDNFRRQQRGKILCVFFETDKRIFVRIFYPKKHKMGLQLICTIVYQ